MRLQPLSARRCHAILVLAMVFAVLPCSIATAGPILLKFDVILLQPGSPVDADLGVDVNNGAVEIDNASLTDVGLAFFSDEFVDFTSDATMTSLAYMIQGGGDPHSEPGYSTSWPLGTAILFGNFVLDQRGKLASVSVTVDEATNGDPRVIGAGGGSLVNGVDYLITFQNNLQLQLFGLGILDQPDQTPLGLMTFHLNFVAEPQVQVPDPASSLMLFGMGMAALATRRRLARRR